MVRLLEFGGVQLCAELAVGVVAEAADLVGGLVHEARRLFEGVLLDEVERGGFAGLGRELGEDGQNALTVFLVEKGVGGVDGMTGKRIGEGRGWGFFLSGIEGEVDGGAKGVRNGVSGVAEGGRAGELEEEFLHEFLGEMGVESEAEEEGVEARAGGGEQGEQVVGHRRS